MSTTSAQVVPAGTIRLATELVKFEGKFGGAATARGVTPHALNATMRPNPTETQRKEVSAVHSVSWETSLASDPHYTIEWLENMSGSFIWPNIFDIKKNDGKQLTLRGDNVDITMSSSIESSGMHRSCAHLSVDGFDFFVGKSEKPAPKNLKSPGFIVYKGTPSNALREKIRDCLSFSLGTYLIHLGHTCFDEHWNPVSFEAVSAHTMHGGAFRLHTLPPAPLGNSYQREISRLILEKMLISLIAIYDDYNLRSVFWAYWHAIAAPAHIASVHFGAAIESLQRKHSLHQPTTFNTTVLDKNSWDDLSKKIIDFVESSNGTNEEKTIIKNKVLGLNHAPQGVVMNRFIDSLKMELGPIELSAWNKRNRAAHGSEIREDKYIEVIRENKALMILMNRIILAISGAADLYHDYYTIGHPLSRLSRPIPNDKK